jgi:hypothetical protein
MAKIRAEIASIANYFSTLSVVRRFYKISKYLQRKIFKIFEGFGCKILEILKSNVS